jgi:hypothetical protein
LREIHPFVAAEPGEGFLRSKAPIGSGDNMANDLLAFKEESDGNVGSF